MIIIVIFIMQIRQVRMKSTRNLPSCYETSIYGLFIMVFMVLNFDSRAIKCFETIKSKIQKKMDPDMN